MHVLLEETLKSRQDKVRLDEFRGQISCRAGGFAHILQSKKKHWRCRNCCQIDVQMELGTPRLFPSSPQSALSAVVCTLKRNQSFWAHPPRQCQKTERENKTNLRLMWPVQKQYLQTHFRICYVRLWHIATVQQSSESSCWILQYAGCAVFVWLKVNSR